MAYDPFIPEQEPAMAPAGPSPEQESGLASQWNDWLAQPANRAALLQFGVSMMQPVGLGQSSMGHVGQAIGQAGEATARIRAEDLKQQEADSKAELRSSQATAAEARAGTAAANAGRAADRLAMQQEGIGLRRENMRLTNLVRLQGSYQRAVDEIRRNNSIAAPSDRQKEPTFQEWLAGNPHLSSTLGAPEGAEPGSDVPPMTGARRGRDGQWYVERNGKFFRVD